MHYMLAEAPRIAPRTLLILDPAIDQVHFNRQNQILSNVELVILDADQDGILQISDFLATRLRTQGCQTALVLHLIALASPGCLYLGNSVLSLNTLTTYTEQLKGWGCTSISLYADDLVTGDAGEEWLTKLHQLTGATVHAAQPQVKQPQAKQPQANHLHSSQWELVLTVAKGQVISHAAMPFGVLV